ncbi:MAG: hypothetical protein ACYCSN_03340 [Acidobacteriaceae bacterium]
MQTSIRAHGTQGGRIPVAPIWGVGTQEAFFAFYVSIIFFVGEGAFVEALAVPQQHPDDPL